MGGEEIEILRGYELRLLRCTLHVPPSNPSPPSDSDDSRDLYHALISDMLCSIEAGDFIEALSSRAARLVLEDSSELSASPEAAYSELLDRVKLFISADSVDDSERACRVILVMCIAVAAFFYFTQCNLTGPLEGLLKRPLPMKAWWDGHGMEEWEDWARNELMAAGSDLAAKFSFLQYIVFAEKLLELLLKIRDSLCEPNTVVPVFEIRSISWWLFRVLLLHQRILNGQSSSLFKSLQDFKRETLGHFGKLENVTSYWGEKLLDGEGSTIVTVVHLEAGVLEYEYNHLEEGLLGYEYDRLGPCREHFNSALVAAGLELSVTGVLGFRTVHQVEPKAQRVLLVKKCSKSSGGTCTSSGPGLKSCSSRISEDSDIFITPKLLENGSGAPLTAVEQAVILTQCLLIGKTAPQDEMQGWDLAPYIEAIDSQQSSYFMLQCLCYLLRSRWESTRIRTMEDASLRMSDLVKQIQTASCIIKKIQMTSLGASHRLPLCFVVHFPTIPALRKEYCRHLCSWREFGEASEIYDDLELWDELIDCKCMMGKKSEAVELISRRLVKTPNDPRLWCTWGDITNNDKHYETAWKVSCNTSARAKRSLARSACARGDYQTAKIQWESAMALNSLYPGGWFALGFAAMETGDVQRALDAFTCAIQLDPENWKAWSNIAYLHLIRKKKKESFTAYAQAVKFMRDSWKLWENYGLVAVEVGSIFQALDAARKVLDVTNYKRTGVRLLDRITQYLEESSSNSHSAVIDGEYCANKNFTDSCIYSVNKLSNSEPNEGMSPEKRQMVKLLGNILEEVSRHNPNADIWGLCARCHRMNGDLIMCSNELLKQIRSYKGSDLWKDGDRFRRFADALLELCKIYIILSSSIGSHHQQLLSAERELQSAIKQGSSFSGTEEFQNLQACLLEVKMKLQSMSAVA